VRVEKRIFRPQQIASGSEFTPGAWCLPLQCHLTYLATILAIYAGHALSLQLQKTRTSSFVADGSASGMPAFTFTAADEALAAIEAVNADYRRHCEAARSIAEEYFEARSVAARLLADLNVT
jgi:hypothetical protein